MFLWFHQKREKLVARFLNATDYIIVPFSFPPEVAMKTSYKIFLRNCVNGIFRLFGLLQLFTQLASTEANTIFNILPAFFATQVTANCSRAYCLLCVLISLLLPSVRASARKSMKAHHKHVARASVVCVAEGHLCRRRQIPRTILVNTSPKVKAENCCKPKKFQDKCILP